MKKPGLTCLVVGKNNVIDTLVIPVNWHSFYAIKQRRMTVHPFITAVYTNGRCDDKIFDTVNDRDDVLHKEYGIHVTEFKD